MRRSFLQLLLTCAAACQLLVGSAAAAAGSKTTIVPSSSAAALAGGSGGALLSHLPPPNSAAISATSTLSGSIMSGSLVGTASTTTSSNSSAGSSPQQLLPLVLQYNDTNVPYNRDSLNTGSFKPYYYVASTLIAGWRTYLLQVGRGMGRKASSGPVTFNVARAIFRPPPSPLPCPLPSFFAVCGQHLALPHLLQHHLWHEQQLWGRPGPASELPGMQLHPGRAAQVEQPGEGRGGEPRWNSQPGMHYS